MVKGITVHACAMLAAALLATAAAGAPSPAAKCQSAKLKITANYSSCRLKAQSKAVKSGTAAELSAALAKCDTTFTKKWTAAEQRGGPACPTTDDAGSQQTLAFDFSHFAALALAPTRFIDNGDGTVTDTRTRLQWEQKRFPDGEANYGDPHDVDNTYTWSATGTAPDGTAFTQFLGALNDCTIAVGTGFAGHCDWRLPKFEELESINYVAPPNCPVTPCIDPTLQPVGPSLSLYWSVTKFDGPRAKAKGFTPDGTCDCPKTIPNYVRAVRNVLGPGELSQ